MGMPFRYNYRNLFRRKLRTALTVLGIALVIFIAVIMLAYSRGLLYSLRNNGDPENILVLPRQASDRVDSSMKKGEFEILGTMMADRIAYFPPTGEEGDATRRVDEPGPVDLIAPFVLHTALITIEGVEGGRYGERKLGLIMGVDPERVCYLNSRFKLLRGRMFTGEDERVALVGTLAYARLGVQPEDLQVGKVIEFNEMSWTIVGMFDASGTAAEGEIWVPVEELMAVLGRPDYSYAVIKAENMAALDEMLQEINRSDQVVLRAESEVEYYSGHAELFQTFAVVAGVMALIITLGGVLVGMNTMYTAVAGRVREIGMLQVLGFSKSSIVVSFVLESMLIALMGGIIGCGLGQLVNGIPMKVTMGVFLFRVDALVLGLALGLALAIGLVGALIPAVQAVRLRMVDAMRYM